MSKFRILFDGHFLAGHDPAQARQKLLQALGAGPEVEARLFSGHPISLKTGLDADKAERYRQRLEEMGLVVRVEATEAASPGDTGAVPADSQGGSAENAGEQPTPAEPVDSVPTPAPALAVSAERMQCPQCGHRQAKRNLCQACGVDMQRFAAAQDGGEGQLPAVAGDADEARDGMHGHSVAGDDDAGVAAPALIGFGISGRMARKTYFVSTAVVWLLMAVGVMLALGTLGIVGAIALFALLVVPTVRPLILRLHDLGWSAWWALLFFVPLVGSILALVLLFVPGTAGSNAYGPRPATHGWLAVIASLVAFVALPAAVAAYSLPKYTEYAEAAQAAAAIGQLSDYKAGANVMVVFSTRDCEPCDMRREQYRGAGLQFTEFFVDEDPLVARQLDARLRESGRVGTPAFPVVQVNDTLISGAPSLLQIAPHLKQQ